MDLRLVGITRRRIFALFWGGDLIQRFLRHSMYINPGSFISQRIFLVAFFKFDADSCKVYLNDENPPATNNSSISSPSPLGSHTLRTNQSIRRKVPLSRGASPKR